MTPLRVYTSTLAYEGAGRLDCTRGSGGWFADPFAPSKHLLSRYHPAWGGIGIDASNWKRFREAYLSEMRVSYRQRPDAWGSLFVASPLVLCCHEPPGAYCHRLILGREILPKLGAVYEGEIDANDRKLGVRGEGAQGAPSAHP